MALRLMRVTNIMDLKRQGVLKEVPRLLARQPADRHRGA
jgi:hypothetical protein